MCIDCFVPFKQGVFKIFLATELFELVNYGYKAFSMFNVVDSNKNESRVVLKDIIYRQQINTKKVIPKI